MTPDPLGPLLERDTKDWTWVLDRACGECGFDAGAFDRLAIPRAFRRNAQVWFALLADPDAGERTRSDRWSTLEYACHVHDVHQIYHDRVAQMLADDNPLFDNWDQDQAAVDGRYDESAAVDRRADPGGLGVRDERPLRLRLSDVVAATRPAQRRPRVHRRDSREVPAPRRRAPPPRRAVRRAGRDGPGVRRVRRRLPSRAPPRCRRACERRSTGSPGLVRPGARVLEIGSGSGRDARALEEGGLSVRRTDITPAFVHLLRDGGHEADVRRPARRRPRRPGRARHAVRRGLGGRQPAPRRPRRPAAGAEPARRRHRAGTVCCSSALKEGDGEDWSRARQRDGAAVLHLLAGGAAPVGARAAPAGG